MGAKAKITRGKTSGRAKPAAAKPTKKTKASNATGASAKPAAAKQAKKAAAKPAKKAAAKSAKKALAAKPAKKPAVAKKAAMPAVATATPPAPPTTAMPDAFAAGVDDDIAVDADVGKKPGALARLGRGVGSLFAKVTGRGKKKPVDDYVPNKTTIEIVTEDIVATKPVGAKPPLPPGVDD
jgi:hypothetical protein